MSVRSTTGISDTNRGAGTTNDDQGWTPCGRCGLPPLIERPGKRYRVYCTRLYVAECSNRECQWEQTLERPYHEDLPPIREVNKEALRKRWNAEQRKMKEGE